MPLLSAILGAFVGAAAAGLIRYIEEKRSRSRECKALLMLIDAEVYEHIRWLQVAQQADQEHRQFGDKSGLYELPRFTTSHWDASKQRLAQLLPSKYIGTLIMYYKALDDAELFDISSELMREQPTEERYRARTFFLGSTAERLIPMANEVRRMYRNLAGDIPDYLDLARETRGQP